MSFTNVVDTDAAAPLIPDEAVTEVLKAMAQSSAALALCVTRQMSTKQATAPVLSTLPHAYWVQNGLKQVTSAAWEGLSMTAAEVATIIPVLDEVLEDSYFNIWNELRDPIATELGRVLDAAVFAGTDQPSEWEAQALIPAARAAGNVAAGGASAEAGGVYDDVAAAMDLVEASGHEVTALAAQRALKGRMRRARNAIGDLQAGFITDRMWDVPVAYPVSTSMPADTLVLAGDFSSAVIGIRRDLRYELFREGVISDADGNIIRNLMQEDTSAMRITARFGFTWAVPATLDDPDREAVPFAVLESGAAAQSTSARKSAKS